VTIDPADGPVAVATDLGVKFDRDDYGLVVSHPAAMRHGCEIIVTVLTDTDETVPVVVWIRSHRDRVTIQPGSPVARLIVGERIRRLLVEDPSLHIGDFDAPFRGLDSS
jgi:hypothetical protein